MKSKNWFRGFSIYGFYLSIMLLQSSYALASGKLIFAYSQDAPPISRTGDFGGIEGFCKDLLDFLESKEKWQIKKIPITYIQRFKGLPKPDNDSESMLIDKMPAIECGPNSINSQRAWDLTHLENGNIGRFSNPFFVTQSKLIINKNNLRTFFDNTSPLASETLIRSNTKTPEPLVTDPLIVGVQSDTTNNAVIRKILPFAMVKKVENRDDAIKKLAENDIHAYFGDEAILRELIKHSDLNGNFVMVPRLNGFTQENYGIVVYNDDDLLSVVNDWIKEDGYSSRKSLDRSSSIDNLTDLVVRSNYYYVFITCFIGIFLLLFFSNPIFLLFITKLIPKGFKRALLAFFLRVKVSNRKDNSFGKLIGFLASSGIRALHVHAAEHSSSIQESEMLENLYIVRELGIRPLYEEYKKQGLSSEQAISKLKTTLSQVVGELGIRPLYEGYLEQGLSNEQAIARLESTLNEVERNNSVISGIIRTWFDTTKSQSIEAINLKIISLFIK
jgi:ABC-type amino acid transport substrate-binding protein